MASVPSPSPHSKLKGLQFRLEKEVNPNVFGLLCINSEGELPLSSFMLLALEILSKKMKT